MRDLQQAVRSIDEALAILTGVPLMETAPRAAGAEPLKVIIQRILTDKPGLAPADISAALKDLGRETNVNTVLGTLHRSKDEGMFHKRGRVWYAGAGESNADDVMPENEEAPDHSEALQKFGDVAELEDQGALNKSEVAQHPIRNRENVGSSPTVSSPIAKGLMVSASPLSVSRNPQQPWFKR